MGKKLEVGVLVNIIGSSFDQRCIGMQGTVIEHCDLTNNIMARIMNIGPWLVDIPQMRNLLCSCGKHPSEGVSPFHTSEIVPVNDPDEGLTEIIEEELVAT